MESSSVLSNWLLRGINVVFQGAEHETFHIPHSAFHFPWTGGLNACQFGRMDLDGDGKKDLLVFDRHGNRLLCFFNKGGVGEIDYQYTTDYDEAFPKLNDWVVFVDYDGDGKEDIVLSNWLLRGINVVILFFVLFFLLFLLLFQGFSFGSSLIPFPESVDVQIELEYEIEQENKDEGKHNTGSTHEIEDVGSANCDKESY